jgi:hypothetical protein
MAVGVEILDGKAVIECDIEARGAARDAALFAVDRGGAMISVPPNLKFEGGCTDCTSEAENNRPNCLIQ